MMDVDHVMARLQASARPEDLSGMARYGMTADRRLGIKIPVLRQLAKEIGPSHDLALALWKTGLAEAQILASLLAEPHSLTEAQMETWVADFNSWDICDQVCMNLFDRTSFAWWKPAEWAGREPEFTRRAAFALVASLAVHDKKAPDDAFVPFLPLIRSAAGDERNYVKKAVSWALRSIGKRTAGLHSTAMQMAKDLRDSDLSAAHWIAADTMRDLTSEATSRRLGRKQAG